MLVEGINGLENQKSFHMALEFVTLYNFDMYLPSGWEFILLKTEDKAGTIKCLRSLVKSTVLLSLLCPYTRHG